MPTRREARTSVLPGGQNLGAGGIQFRRADRGALCAPQSVPRAAGPMRASAPTEYGGAGGRKGHPCLCARAEKDRARPQNTGVPVFAGGPERLGGEICRFYFWNQRARPRSSKAFRVAWGSFTLARKIMAAMM